jgi:hypothetical protein
MTNLKEEILEILSKWDKDSYDSLADQIIQKFLDILPKEVKMPKKHSGKTYCPQCEDAGYNECLQDLKSKLNKL